MYHKHRLPGIFSNYLRLNNIVHDHYTRGSNDIHVTAVNNNYGRRSITHKAGTLWTNLSTALKEYTSINKFSKNLNVGGLIVYQAFFFLSSSFSRQPISELAERNSTIFGHMVSVIWKRMSEIWSIPSPYKPGAQSHLFSTTSLLNGKFNGLCLWNETWYRQLGKCVANCKGSATSSRNVMNFGPQTASNWKWVFTHPP